MHLGLRWRIGICYPYHICGTLDTRATRRNDAADSRANGLSLQGISFLICC